MLLDQRGTGLSTGISTKSLLRRGSPAQQAEYLTHFRCLGPAQECTNGPRAPVVRLLQAEERMFALMSQKGCYRVQVPASTCQPVLCQCLLCAAVLCSACALQQKRLG